MLLNTYRYDKFHIIYDDLLSLIENEIKSEKPVSHNAPFFLQVKSLDEFIEFEQSIPSLGDVGNNRDFLEQIFATEKRNSYLETHKKIFGADKDLKKSRDFLKKNHSALIPSIVGLRNLFSHKHQTPIQKKYAESWQDLDIDKIVKNLEKLFSIIKDIYLLNTRTAHKGIIGANFKTAVSNQIDLILFGNIENCIHTFTEHFPNQSYNHSRNDYYKSRYFIEKIVHRE